MDHESRDGKVTGVPPRLSAHANGGCGREPAALTEDQADQRSDPRARRRWLRFLDPVLTDEIREAGALSCEELIEMAGGPLDGRASRETIEEWWEYAHRRSWLEEYGTGRRRLTSLGRADVRELRQRISGPDPAEGGKTIIRRALPAGAIGAAALLSGNYLTIGIAIVAVCVTLALMFFIAAPIGRLMDRPMDRWIARRACDWLDGRRVRWWIRQHPAITGEVRRLYESDEPRAAESSPAPASTGSAPRPMSAASSEDVRPAGRRSRCRLLGVIGTFRMPYRRRVASALWGPGRLRMHQRRAALWRRVGPERANRGGQPTQFGGPKVETGNSQKQSRVTKDASAAPATT